MRRVLLFLGILRLTLVGAAGSLQLILDFYPNPNHIPIYVT